MSERLAYSLAEAAQLSSLSVRSLRYLMQQGKLGFAKVGRRILVPHVELERLLRRASVKPTQTIYADEPIRPRGKNTKAGSTTLPAQEMGTAHSDEKAVPFEVISC
jgi:excisionase family DNA binding protein